MRKSTKGDGTARGGSGRATGGWGVRLKLAASLALLTFVLLQADLEAVLHSLLNVRPAWLVLGVGLQFIGPALIALRWQGLLSAQGIRPGWLYLYESTLVAGFFRQFLPSIVGGDVIRGYDACRAGARVGQSAMILLLDRLFGLLALAILAAVAVLASQEVTSHFPQLRVWVFVAMAVTGGLLAVLLTSGGDRRLPFSVPEKLKKIGAALRLSRTSPASVLRALGLSLLLQVNVVTFYWVISKALGLEVSYLSFYAIAPIAILVMMLPISINGIGVREGIFAFLLGLWSVKTSDAIALAWLEYSMFLAFGLLGGVLYLLRRGRHPGRDGAAAAADFVRAER